jgi:hypothetical protein
MVIFPHMARKRDRNRCGRPAVAIMADLRPMPSGCTIFVMQHLVRRHVQSAFGNPFKEEEP